LPEQGDVYTLAQYRLEKAAQCYADAVLAFENGACQMAANRSYYCIFHAMRAVLALDEFDSKKHSGIIAAFRQKYIKTNILPESFSDVIKSAFNLRSKSDYDDFYLISTAEVEEQIRNAKIFLDGVTEYLQNRLREK
jgi:uncharacterized protein (UPF0332 family)